MFLEGGVGGHEETQSIIEMGKVKFLPFKLLHENDVLTFSIARLPWLSYATDPDRLLRLQILGTTVENHSARAFVLEDSYLTDGVESRKYSWALPLGAEITLIGSSNHFTREVSLGGLLSNCGIEYLWRENNQSTYTAPVQEITLERDSVAITVFGNDLSQPAPYPQM